MAERKNVTIYTDGGCIDNPGPGGYGVVLLYGTHRRELSGGFRLTTNNRMEIMAAIAGLSSLKESCRVTLYSDSQYLVNAIEEGWAERWRENGWKRNKKEMALNPDLWEELLELCKKHRVKFKWLRGHAGNEENERCDELAQAMARSPDLPPDLEYEKTARVAGSMSG
jgi:ribonuclease HI